VLRRDYNIGTGYLFIFNVNFVFFGYECSPSFEICVYILCIAVILDVPRIHRYIYVQPPLYTFNLHNIVILLYITREYSNN